MKFANSIVIVKKIRKTSTVRQKSHDLSRFVAIDVLTFAGLMLICIYTIL